MPHPVIELRGVRKTYFKPDGSIMVEALSGVEATIELGDYVAIMGASGSGKSTLMNVLGCLDRPTAGEYLLDARDVAKMPDEELSGYRGRKIGFVFQAFNLIPELTIEENVSQPLFYQSVPKRDRIARATATSPAPSVGAVFRSCAERYSASMGARLKIMVAASSATRTPT